MAELTVACEACRGRGFLVEPDGGAGTARLCPCRSSASHLEILLRAAGLEPAELRMAARAWDPEWPVPAWMESWAERVARGRRGALCRVLLGPTGAGKTMQAAKVAAAYVQAGGRRLLWCGARAAEQRIMRERRLGDSELEAALPSAELLIVDDLAYQLFGLPQVVRQREIYQEHYRRRMMMWFSILDQRLRAERATLLTSNLHPSEWGHLALASRLSVPGTLKGLRQEDYRPHLRASGAP